MGFIRTYASMIAMMVLNVLFLKLILSALATMPSGIYVLPWCLLVVGIARVARKADNLISKIGLNPAVTGDPLGHGRGMMAVMMAARTIMNSTSRACLLYTSTTAISCMKQLVQRASSRMKLTTISKSGKMGKRLSWKPKPGRCV